MGCTNDDQRLQIVQLHADGMKPTEIMREMSRRGVTIDRRTIYRILKKWKETQSIADKERETIIGHDVTLEIMDFIDKCMEEDNELYAHPLQQKILATFGVNFSVTKVKRLRRKLRWVSKKSRYCQLIKHRNRPKRVEYAEKRIAEGDTFDDCLFSDECSVQMESHGRITFHKIGEQAPLKGRPKHPLKVHVWAAISKRGASPIAIFQGIMESNFFVGQLLREVAKPFIDTVFPDGHRFLQDNDPKHTSGLSKAAYEELQINWFQTPAESPDLNPIENLWHELKHYLRSYVKPRTKAELINGITEFWVKITPERCTRYIDHLQKVLPAVITREGRATGY